MLGQEFPSLSWYVPQLSHLHSLISRVRSRLMAWQIWHSFDVGENRAALRWFFPYQSHLYSNWRKNSPHPASPMAWASVWLRFIPSIFKSSVHRVSTWLSWVNRYVCLWRKSLRWLAIRSCNRASFNRAFSRFLLPFFFLSCCLSRLFRIFKDFFRWRGFSTFRNFVRSWFPIVAKWVNPISGASDRSMQGSGFLGCSLHVSTRIDAKYLPVGVFLMVTVLMMPLNGRCSTMGISDLNLGSEMRLFSQSTTTFCGHANDSHPPFDLKCGYLDRFSKKFLYAASRLRREDCRDWALTSFSHSNSFFNPINCDEVSLNHIGSPYSLYDLCLASNARLYTSLVQPKCCSSNEICSAEGYRRYLNDLSINSNISKIVQFLAFCIPKINQRGFKMLFYHKEPLKSLKPIKASRG